MLAKLYRVITPKGEQMYVVATSLSHAAMWCEARQVEVRGLEFCGSVSNLDFGESPEELFVEEMELPELDGLDEEMAESDTVH
jgi:hypothetical protein